ncbi:hypothetical protein [Streptomyces sp. Ag109_G2-15]|uniref:hypothetical protein n=1 Tax=Streptomyces sp. Ag109_G2-15 TaxID=1938850 RepID=UPI000BCF5AAD|nr:hypothetical protein [Streptomyces sp. Ag109_G2-15]SOD85566.1 hypothetical protein SAMN06272765_2998 [Streptomyces sp. Ag109_G2-15]
MELGTLLYDPATDRVGEYQDRSGPYAMLRPVGGGREWQADPDALRPATDRERLHAGVRAANDRTAALPSAPLDVVSRPPRPVPGCPACLQLGERREAARAVFDRSAETDANVLLRQHQGQEHRA